MNSRHGAIVGLFRSRVWGTARPKCHLVYEVHHVSGMVGDQWPCCHSDTLRCTYVSGDSTTASRDMSLRN